MSAEVEATGEAIGIISRIIGWVSHRLGRRIKIKELKRATDSDLHETAELYERLFKEEFRVYPAELTAWLRESSSKNQTAKSLQHCLLIAKRRGKVVALLKAMYCPISGWAFIAYFGVDKADTVTRKIASKLLMKFFSKYVFSRWKNCRGVAFEIECCPSNASKEQKLECNARRRLFKDIARHQGHHAFEVKIDYHQPLMADAPQYRGMGRKMSLMVVLTKDCDSVQCKIEEIKRADVEAILNFLYFNIYGMTQEIPNRRRDEYHRHLAKVYAKVSETVKDAVELEL